VSVEIGAEVLRENIEFVAHSDQGGRGDGVQIVLHRGYAYIGHMFSNGVSVLDVRDPRNLKPVNFLAAPPMTWSIHVQAADDLLLVINAANLFGAITDEKAYYGGSITQAFAGTSREFSAGLRVFDIARPEAPREIGFMPVDGLGLHRIWYVGGRYAYVSAQLQGFTDYIFMVVDLQDPTRPEPIGRWWLPGMWQAGGETPGWDTQRYRYALHHAIVADGIAYGSWRDGGLTLLDVRDPGQPKLLAHSNWCPPFGGGTHTSLPLPSRNLAVVADEGIADNCADQVKYTWVVDVREPTNPVNVATFPTPTEEDYCAKGGHFGPHNLHENRPGGFQSSELIFATYQNAGVRVFDIADHLRPRQVAYFVPPAPERMFDTRPNRARVIQTCDVYVDRQGLLYVTDYNAGLYVLEFKGA
jgi:hypothetical protein